MKKGKVLYYRDEINDDFAGTDIKPFPIGPDFPFAPKSLLWRVFEFLAYYVFAIPIVSLIYLFVGFSFHNLRAIKKLKKASHKGFFIYANHTSWLDAFLAPIICFPRKAHVLVSPDTVSIKGIRTLVQMLGAIPVPTERGAVKPFISALEERIDQGRSVMIFPEAHIWPYCTFIRNFKAGSFRYPVSMNVPSVAVCVAYVKRRGVFRLIKTPRRRVFVSEPFCPDTSLPAPEAKQKLRDEVYSWLKNTADSNNEFEYVRYVRKA